MKADTISHWLDLTAATSLHKTLLTFLRQGRLETELNGGQLCQDIHQLANTLVELGVQKGDRVILFLPKSVVALVAHFAIQAIGGISVPLNPGFKRDEMAYLLADADPSLVIVSPETVKMIEELDSSRKFLEVATGQPYQQLDFFRTSAVTPPAVAIAGGDPGLIIYTSGTTGKPKGVVLTHANLVADARNIIKVWQISADDVLCHALPLFHVHGLCFALQTPLLCGAHIRLLDQFQPKHVVAELSRACPGPCTMFMAVPTMYAKLIDSQERHGGDFAHLRLLTSGSAPLLVREFERITHFFGKEPVEREGMTETGMNFSNPLQGRRIAGSIGLPLPGLQVRVVDPATLVNVAQGEVGEIWLKSRSIFTRYWRKPRETADTFREGWFRTGDLGRVDAAGYYYLTDRIKHIIISGGENVSAREVENVINQFDGVVESVVVGLPDRQFGEKVVAAVVAQAGVELIEADLKNHCRSKLHDWKCPREFHFLAQIPRNTMGKVLKEAVQKMLCPRPYSS